MNANQLLRENGELRIRLQEAEQTLEAIRTGAVDALVINGPEEEQVFSLRGAERPYRVLVETINEGALMLSSDGLILFANASFAEMVQSPLEDIIGTPFLSFIPEPEQMAFKELFTKGFNDRSTGELLLDSNGGTLIPVHLSVRAMDDDGIKNVCVVITNLSGIKHAEKKLQAAYQELEKHADKLETSNQSLESFCYSVAHDLRAPLRAIQGFSEILLESHADGLHTEAQDYLQRMATAACRMDEMIQALLQYGRLSQQEVPMERVDLADEIKKTIKTLEPDIQEKHAVVEVQTSLPAVRSNSIMLDQVLTNVLGNAVKFSRPGIKPVVNISARKKQNSVVIRIRDNGIGIDPSHQAQIFRIFERLHEPGQYPGTGIGLAIVKKAVEKMGGNVGVESELNKGSCFWIELPRAN